MTARLLFAFVGFAAIAAASPAFTMISNGDFEAGLLNPWAQTADFGGDSDWAITSGTAHTGVYSATVAGNKLLQQDLWANPPGADIVEFSFWLKASDTQNTLVVVSYTDSTFDSDIASPVSNDWTFYDFTSIIDLSKNVASVAFWGTTYGGSIPDPVLYLDDVKLESLSVPEPATLGALAVGLLVLSRRRRSN